ncbi:MAG: zeaxanthin glucosyltransferase [Gammaproteobacteria bacterium]|jgi:zeaxanthin glucosyltransferase
MATVGIVCPSAPSHLYSAGSLGRELTSRGHRVILFGTSGAEPFARAAGVDFHPYGLREFSAAANAEWFARLGRLRGTRALREVERLLATRAAVRLAELPAAARGLGVDALLVDQCSAEGGSIAERLDVPFMSVCSSILLNRDADVPPFNTLWHYSPSLWARNRNRVGNWFLDCLTSTSRRVIIEQRRRWGLPHRPRQNDLHSTLAQLCQQPEAFEFPRRHLPRCLHFTGPFQDAASRAAVDFPYERLSDQPLVYASMGTLLTPNPEVFHCIAEACSGLDLQLVLSTGRAPIPDDLDRSVLAVQFAPQIELLSRATLGITHAGLSSVLQCLNSAVPMVAIPVSSDQPGIAARLQWSGAGEYVPIAQLNSKRLRKAVIRVLHDPGYREHAMRLSGAIQRAGGVARAADLVEQVLTTGEPVFAR